MLWVFLLQLLLVLIVVLALAIWSLTYVPTCARWILPLVLVVLFVLWYAWYRLTLRADQGDLVSLLVVWSLVALLGAVLVYPLSSVGTSALLVFVLLPLPLLLVLAADRGETVAVKLLSLALMLVVLVLGGLQTELWPSTQTPWLPFNLCPKSKSSSTV